MESLGLADGGRYGQVLGPVLLNRYLKGMSIHNRCKQLQRVADRMFMDFKYTSPGSKEQLSALKTFNDQVRLWADFLLQEERRMSAALAVKASV
mgnify:CR=1 FL=1